MQPNMQCSNTNKMQPAEPKAGTLIILKPAQGTISVKHNRLQKNSYSQELRDPGPGE